MQVALKERLKMKSGKQNENIGGDIVENDVVTAQPKNRV